MNKKISPYMLLLLPSVICMTVFLALPLLWVLLQSFTEYIPSNSIGGGFTLKNYLKFFTDSYYYKKVLGKTLWLTFEATFYSLVIGYLGAYILAHSKTKYKPFLVFAVMAPQWVSLVVRLFGWMLILGDKGVLNAFLLYIGLIKKPLNLMYNETAVLVGMIQFAVPFVILSLYGILESIPHNLEEACMSVGGSYAQTFLRVTLPLSVPGIISAAMLAFGLNVSTYVIPKMMSGGKTRMLAMLVYDQVMLNGNLPFAAAMGTIVVIISIISILLFNRCILMLNPSRSSKIARE